MSKIRIIIVEDEIIISKTLEFSLEKMGFEVCGIYSSGEETISNFEKINPDLVILDINLDGQMDGIETGEWIKSKVDIPIIYMTGYPDKELKDRAQLTRPEAYFLKPVDLSILKSTICTCTAG